MMFPFRTGWEEPPTEADWHAKQADLALERAEQVSNDRHYARKNLEQFIRESLAKDREYTLSLFLGILAEQKQ